MNNISPPILSYPRPRKEEKDNEREGETMAIITVADTQSVSPSFLLPLSVAPFPTKRKTKRKEGRNEGEVKAVGRRHKTGLATRLSLADANLPSLSFLRGLPYLTST